MIGLISNSDESAYTEEVQHLTAWCANNDLALNTKKTKELIVDYRKSNDGTHTPIRINGTEVELVTSFTFLGVHISEDLSWTLNTSTLTRKIHQRLFFLKRLKKIHLSPQILVNFYRCTIESILEALQSKRCLRKARSIVKDCSNPNHRLFTLLPSRRHYRSLCTRTSRFRGSFFPASVTLLDSTPRCTYCTSTDLCSIYIL
ncbi:uncharacterized protein LOC115587475 [Sparus aurata]|uniref:uncharacterized protein LOC115587475 n=1 Tax=Sparus aurata TaxID=8175 RepID=UPI0011C13D4F|nr:uncharacterized protein LOC115587475 [Sparus aurata]